MRRRIVLICFLMLAVLCMFGCQPSTQTPEPIETIPRELVSLSFSESASYFKRVQGYDFHAEDGKYIVCFWIANEDEPYPVMADQAWVDTLNGYISEYDMLSWDGFSGSAYGLLDGTQFRIDFTLSDGTTVHASGYGRFPKNYREASSAIEAHFMQLLPEDQRDW